MTAESDAKRELPKYLNTRGFSTIEELQEFKTYAFPYARQDIPAAIALLVSHVALLDYSEELPLDLSSVGGPAAAKALREWAEVLERVEERTAQNV